MRTAEENNALLAYIAHCLLTEPYIEMRYFDPVNAYKRIYSAAKFRGIFLWHYNVTKNSVIVSLKKPKVLWRRKKR